jgi:hypothetical protein
VAANAASEPCRPMAIIRIRITSSRFIPQSLTGTANQRKPSPRSERLTIRH